MPRPLLAVRQSAARRVLFALLVGLVCRVSPAFGQDLVRSAAPWRTLQTEWFTVHYPLDSEAWALDLAPRLDAVRDAVAALVGYAPPGRTTVVIDDPYNVANGKAIPLLGAPVVHLWVTPPGPTDQIANHRGWGLKLASHEFGHIAHLSRPARRTQWYWHLLPAQVSPLAVFTPRWAVEGYATWIEGQITGSGRPHGAWRPALLRELALQGRLPSYAAMSAGGGYKGGSAAYLAGSAFWEWLAAQRGDTSMTLVFRRQSARIARSFDESFRGVYGESPASLYARFSAELTVKAFAVDGAIRRAGVVEGLRLARFSGAVGGPALSRDGKWLALALPGLNGGPPRVIVTRPDTQPDTKADSDAVRQRLARDPADVAAIRLSPRLAKPAATLTVRHGRVYSQPRFITADGSTLLLESWSVRADGSQRPDLAVWNTTTNVVTLITVGAATQDADPSPDGSQAAAVRCIGGVCDLVLVSLTDGTIKVLSRGSPTTVYSHPRWSPAGRSIVAAVQRSDGLWRLVLVDAESGAERILTPDDDVNRHSPGFSSSGADVVYVSEAGGVPNVESLRVADGVRIARTRVIGSVYEPVAHPDGGVVFLSEHAGGMDLQRLPPDAAVGDNTPDLSDVRLIPAMPRPRDAGVPLSTKSVAAPVKYGIGPRTYRFLAQTALARDGLLHGGVLSSADPANRLMWTVTGLLGTAPAWRGGIASAAWYGSRPHLRGETFWLEQRASRQRDGKVVRPIDARVAGASLATELPIAGAAASQRASVSAFLGSAQPHGEAVLGRATLSAQYGAGFAAGWRRSAGVSSRLSVGALGENRFARLSVGGYANAFRTRLDLRLHQASGGTPLFEQFAVGGFSPPLADEATLSQRIALPSLPAGTVVGPRVYEWRVARPILSLPGTFYAHAVGTGVTASKQTMVVGFERALSIDYLGLVGLPRMRVLAGVAQIVQGPLRNEASLYFTFGWRP